MAVETKKMSNSLVPGGFGDQIKSWPDRIKSFYNDVRAETRKVTAPTWKETRATTTVVVVTVALFALYFFVIDNVIQRAVSALFKQFK
jgi:preprotein translocase subunit SecE